MLRADDHGRAVALRAGTRLASAGRRALAKGDVPAAVNLLDRAAALLPDDANMRPALLVGLGIALRVSGDLARAERVLSEALAGAARDGDRSVELAAEVERLSLLLLSDPAETDRLREELEAAIAGLEDLGDDRTLAHAWTLMGLRFGMWRGQLARGEEALERALDHARRAGDRRQEAEILGQLGFAALFGPMPVADGIARCREVLERERDNRVVEPAISRYLAVLEARLGRFDEARTLAARTVELYDELGMRLFAQAASAMARGDIELLAGDFVAAEEVLRPGLDALEEMGDQGYRSSVAAFLARALFGQGRLDEAEEVAQRAEAAASPDDVWSQTLSRGTRAKVLASRGAFADAEQLGRDTVAVLQETDALELKAVALLDLAEVFVYAGGSREAALSAEQALSLYEQKGNVVAAERARELIGRLAVPPTTMANRAAPAS